MSTERIYSLPQVEKASSWTAKGEPQIELRDHELEKAQKRTALIRARMSPPETLRLPPLLEAHRQKYGIPDGFFKSQASFDRIYVFPIDPFDDDDKMTPGSFLYRANTTKMKDMQEGHRGVLISAGLKAADVLMSHGIEIGHIVTTNKNVPFARRCEVLEDGHQMFYLVMREADLAGSETLAEEILAGKKKTVEVGDETGYQHVIASNDNGTWTTRKKLSVYVQDAW
jgi:hypothetical protein